MSTDSQVTVSEQAGTSKRRRFRRPSFEVSSLTITLPVPLLEKIDHCIEHEGLVSRSAVIRLALTRYFNSNSEGKPADAKPESDVSETQPE